MKIIGNAQLFAVLINFGLSLPIKKACGKNLILINDEFEIPGRDSDLLRYSFNLYIYGKGGKV